MLNQKKNESNVGKGAALIGGLGLAGTGAGLYYQNKSVVKKIENEADNQLKEGRNKLAKNLKLERSEIADRLNRRNSKAKSNYKMDIADLVDNKNKALKISNENYKSTLKHIENGGIKLGPEHGHNIKVNLNTGTGLSKGGLWYDHSISQNLGVDHLTDKHKQFYKDWAKDLKDETTTEINKQARSEGRHIRNTYKSNLESNKNKFIEDTSDSLKNLKDKKNKLVSDVNITKDKSLSKLSKSLRKNAAIGLAATGLAAGGYYLAKKKTDKN